MRIPRLRFSLRTLFIAVFLVASLLGLWIRFGPHLVWKLAKSNASADIAPIPSQPLVAAPPNDNLVICNVGPMSFELPETMAKSVSVHRGIGGIFLQFYENDRSLSLQLPQRYVGGLLQHEIDAFPEKSEMTFPRLYKEIADSQSADFSFGMSHKELRWHKWMLTTRSMASIDFVEYLWRADIEGNLLTLSSGYVFQWSTTDRQWEGMMHFTCALPGDADWIRHACTTFVIEGDPSVFEVRDDASIESIITFTPSTDAAEPSGEPEPPMTRDLQP